MQETNRGVPGTKTRLPNKETFELVAKVSLSHVHHTFVTTHSGGGWV